METIQGKTLIELNASELQRRRTGYNHIQLDLGGLMRRIIGAEVL